MSEIKNETLLNKAFHNYNIAKFLMESELLSDERYLNYIGYHLQQAVELGLKHVLILHGIETPYSHDISQLIYMGKEANVNLCLSPYIDEHSEMFTLWEFKSRYVLDYQLEADKVQKALEEVNLYLRGIETQLSKELQNGEKTAEKEPRTHKFGDRGDER